MMCHILTCLLGSHYWFKNALLYQCQHLKYHCRFHRAIHEEVKEHGSEVWGMYGVWQLNSSTDVSVQQLAMLEDLVCVGSHDYMIQQLCIKCSLVFSFFCGCSKCLLSPAFSKSKPWKEKKFAQAFQQDCWKIQTFKKCNNCWWRLGSSCITQKQDAKSPLERPRVLGTEKISYFLYQRNYPLHMCSLQVHQYR